MPRDLADVLHYLLPEAGADPTPPPLRRGRTAPASDDRSLEPVPAPLPILALPIGDADVVRAALAWNLVVELSRSGACASLVVPAMDQGSPLWPEGAEMPLNGALIESDAHDPRRLYQAALAEARARAREGDGLVLTRVPPAWLREESLSAEGLSELARSSLLLTTSERSDRIDTYGLAKQLRAANPAARIGLTVHGVRSRKEAEETFDKLSAAVARHLSCRVTSYGALVDDLHVYRAIAARRPIGIAHPQSSASRALADVAALLMIDAKEWRSA